MKGLVDICSFLRKRTPPNMGNQKSFFCVNFPKTKKKTISNSPKRLFPIFGFSSRDKSLCNLAMFENAQNLRDKFWNPVCKNRNLGPERTPFYFWGVFRLFAFRKKFDTGCGTLSRRNLAFSLQNALISRDFEHSWTIFPRFWLWKAEKYVFCVFSGWNLRARQ